MVGRLTLTVRYTLFLAGVMLVMLIGANLITANVVRGGLRNLFERRLDYAGETLNFYITSHLRSRWSELNTLLTSPRFLAAIETADSSTINEEVPGYVQLIGADIIVVTDAAGATMFALSELSLLPDLQASLMRHHYNDTVIILDHSAGAYETFLSDIRTADGYRLGRIAAGFAFDRTVLQGIKKLTGFDAMVTYRGRVIGQTASLPGASRDPDDSQSLNSSSSERVPTTDKLTGEKVVSRTHSLPALGCEVTLLASLDEEINPILQSQLRQMFVLALIAGLLAIGIVYLFVRRRIGGQVTLLVAATERIARDDMDFEITSASHDEFGYLAGQLNRMRTRLLQNRRELEKAHEERIRATRLATLGQLAAGIIHDFKNPVAVIRGTAELMTESAGDDTRLTRRCYNIIDQVDRITSLTQDILEYSRGRAALNLSATSLGQYIDDLVRTYTQELERRRLTLGVIPGKDVGLSLDRIRFRRVLDNLITNAMEVLQPDGTINITWTVQGETVSLHVADNGPGIPPEIVDTLFEPFVTSGKVGGTGLGLAISRKIVEEHGGTISVTLPPHGGACFKLDLPCTITSVTTPAADPLELKGVHA